jgi:hypothetical protein
MNHTAIMHITQTLFKVDVQFTRTKVKTHAKGVTDEIKNPGDTFGQRVQRG